MDIQKERELLKAICKMDDDLVDCEDLCANEKWILMGARAAQAQAVPEGFAVVPVEITPKQIEAYMKGKVFPASMGEHRKFIDRLSKDYRAMIEAVEPADD